MVDRVCDVSRYFPLALDLGCGRSHIATATSDDITGYLIQCDMAENALVMIGSPNISDSLSLPHSALCALCE